MRKIPTAVVLGAATLGVMSTVAPAAQAVAEDRITGGCVVKAFQLANTTTFTGAVSDASATQDDAGAPTGATVKCSVWVNAVTVTPWYEFTGNGTQSGTDPTQFDATIDDNITICKRVVYADALDSGISCTEVQITGVPGGWVLAGTD